MPGIVGDGLHGSRGRGIFRASRRTGVAVAYSSGNDAVLQWLVLCAAGKPTRFNNFRKREVGAMRVERERELRRRRKRREKAQKARRKAALTKVGKWPPAPTKA